MSQSYKLALRLVRGDGQLAPYVDAYVNGDIVVDVVGDVSMVSGSITAATKDKKPAALPLALKLPKSFKAKPAGTFLQGATGATTLQTPAGTVVAGWKTTPSGLLKVAFEVTAKSSARVEGFAKASSVPVVPPGGNPGTLRQGEPLLLAGNVWRNDMTGLVATAVAAGLDGVCVELILEDWIDDDGGFVKHAAKRVAQVAAAVAEVKAAGKWLLVYAGNGNGAKSARASTADWKSHVIDPLAQHLSYPGFILGGIAEPVKFGGEINAMVVALKGRGRIVENRNSGYSDFSDYHSPGKTRLPSQGGWKTFVSTDHSTILAELGLRSQQGKLAEVEAWGKMVLKSGRSAMLYHAGAVKAGCDPDLPTWAALGKARGAGGGSVPPVTGVDAIDITNARQVCIKNLVNNPGVIPVTVQLTAANIDSTRRMVHLHYAPPGIEGWSGGSMGDRLHLYFQLPSGETVGGHCEWWARTPRKLTNVAGNGGDDHGGYFTVRPRKGDKFYFCVIRNDTKARTSVVEADKVWPW